jgi:hypothetical protein
LPIYAVGLICLWQRMKRVAIGRKNWLFAGNDAAGASHARLWMLIASAERRGLNPQASLRSVFAMIGIVQPTSDHCSTVEIALTELPFASVSFTVRK